MQVGILNFYLFCFILFYFVACPSAVTNSMFFCSLWQKVITTDLVMHDLQYRISSLEILFDKQ
jgi:hypothetical protein